MTPGQLAQCMRKTGPPSEAHRPGMRVRAGREGNCRAIAVGAGRTLDPGWMKRRTGGWEIEQPVAYPLPSGHVAAYSVPLVGGACI